MQEKQELSLSGITATRSRSYEVLSGTQNRLRSEKEIIGSKRLRELFKNEINKYVIKHLLKITPNQLH